MNNSKQESIEKLNNLMKNIKTAMLTTIDGGVLRSRPMATQDIDDDGTLWFLTGAMTHKDEEIKRDNRVNVSYAAPDDNTYVSVSGTGETYHDQAKIDELWNPFYKAWFPEGKEDPNIRILRINVEQGEYWDSPSSTFVQVAGFLKALATGKQADGGENEKISL